MKNIVLAITICISTIAIKSAEVSSNIELFNQVREIVCYDVTRFSHDDLVAFGLVCTSNRKYLRDNAQSKKTYIGNIIKKRQSSNVEIDSVRWHPYGSKGGYKTIAPDADHSSIMTRKKLILAGLELCAGGNVRECFGSWPNFETELSFKPTPCYKNGQLYFYGHGWIEIPRNGLCGNVVCYKSSVTLYEACNPEAKKIKEIGNAFQCRLYFKNEDGRYCDQVLVVFLDFPYLLKAIVNCPRMLGKVLNQKKEIVAQPQEHYHWWELENIILPDNYQEFVQSRKEYANGPTFEALPSDLKNALIRRYQEQQKET